MALRYYLCDNFPFYIQSSSGGKGHLYIQSYFFTPKLYIEKNVCCKVNVSFGFVSILAVQKRNQEFDVGTLSLM